MSYWQVDTPYLIIPVETRVREFHAKLLLSCVAAEAGFSVVLGWARQIKKYAFYLPRGIILERSVAIWKLKDFHRFRRLGNHIVAWCEEGLVTFDADLYVRYRVAEDVLRVTDKFFAWGPHQANMIMACMPNSSRKIAVTGNVRFDLLQEPYRSLFDNKVYELREHYGSFILINTNFDLYNNILGREAALSRLKKRRLIKNQEDEDFFWQWSECAGERYQHFVAMIAHLSEAFPQHTIVVRPHPSENFEKWQQATRSFANVHVVHDGNVVPWLIAAEVVIHNNCTTGVEAYVAGTPVVAYRPVKSEKFDLSLSNEISKQVTSLPELQATLREILAQPHAFAHQQQTDPNARKVLNQYVSNIENSFASDQIVSILEQYAQQNALEANDHLHSIRHRTIWRFIQCMNSELIGAASPLIARRTYRGYKFPDISLEEVQNILTDLRKVSGHFERVEVRSVGIKNLFHVSTPSPLRRD
jgi:surface carbohydrate biosynthesis protein